MFLKNSVVLITGGAGAIGINLIDRLLQEDVSKIVVIDNLSSGNINFVPKNEKIKFYPIDIYRIDELKSVMRDIKPEYIFHLAAHFANQNSVEHPLSDIQTNIIGTMNLLELSKENQNLKKFIYASSSCVYGDSAIMSEKDFIYPYETPYAINKYTAELYTKYYAHLFSVPTISVRIFNTYGPYEIAGKYRNVVPRFIENALKNKDIIITGDGTETRDFTYSEDTISLLIQSSLSKEDDGSNFNAGTGIETKIIDLAQLIIKLTASNSKIIFKSRRNWDLVIKRVSNISTAKEILGYNPSISLENGLKKYIKWYKGYLDAK